MKHYQDYFWKEGIPYGIKEVKEPVAASFPTYKIVMDPYRKHISIEKYSQNCFHSVIYDSNFINFRHLKDETHHAWEKTVVKETEDTVICHLRDHNDRLLFQETHFFKEGLCYKCHAVSSHGFSLLVQRMYYKTLHDPFDGVVLFDQNEHPVMCKEYLFDETASAFTDLIKANWDMQHFALL
ncbi:MAG TPA: hypothetical protein PLC42_01240 [Parachlamydiaceae bacterium]|nr:hypothetical protein [Parachlamydiaceae bacterium]